MFTVHCSPPASVGSTGPGAAASAAKEESGWYRGAAWHSMSARSWSAARPGSAAPPTAANAESSGANTVMPWPPAASAWLWNVRIASIPTR